MSAQFTSFPRATDESEIILLVIDNPAERSTISLALRSVGFQVVEAKDGDEAEEKLRSARFDLVITDLVMPERDGLEVLHTVRHDLPNLPVLVLFAILSTVQVIAARIALRLGAKAILSKPLEVQILVEEARRLLAGKPVRRTLVTESGEFCL